jgi:hypothetical protein
VALKPIPMLHLFLCTVFRSVVSCASIKLYVKVMSIKTNDNCYTNISGANRLFYTEAKNS